VASSVAVFEASCDMDKINVYDKVMIENQKKRIMEIKEIFT